jgi:exodeoxyribonuclease X
VLLRTIAERLMPRCDGLADFMARAEKVSAEPALLAKLRFGRHKGVPLAEVPTDYLEWLVAEAGMDADARFTAERQLASRAVRGQRPLPESAVLG